MTVSAAHNPGEWHWKERDCTKWASEYLMRTLKGLSIKANGGKSVVVENLPIIEGEADIMNRKKKILRIWDLKLKIELSLHEDEEKSSSEGSNSKLSASITIPEFTQDIDNDELPTFSVDTSAGREWQEIIRQNVVPALFDNLKQFSNAMLQENRHYIQSQAEIDDAAKESNSSTVATGNIKDQKQQSQAATNTSQPRQVTPGNPQAKQKEENKNGSGKAVVRTCAFSEDYEFQTDKGRLFDVFTNKPQMHAWSRGSVDMSTGNPNEFASGDEFSLFHGNVQGKYISIEKNSMIKQLWRLRTWTQGLYATLTLKFVELQSTTRLEVRMSGIPLGDDGIVRENFEDYYVRSIKATFGYGAML